MKKIIPIFLPFLALISCFCVGCDETSETPVIDDETIIDGVEPGKYREWWFEVFDEYEKIEEFIIKLRDVGKNGEFNFGFSHFEVPDLFRNYYTSFFGLIHASSPIDEDIYNSTYRYFRIDDIYGEDRDEPPYNNFALYFYPFYYQGDTFENSNIKYEEIDYSSGKYKAIFTYDGSKIMEAELSNQSVSYIDKEQMIIDLINNYKLIV